MLLGDIISSRAGTVASGCNSMWIVHDNERISCYSKYYIIESAVTVSIKPENQLLQ